MLRIRTNRNGSTLVMVIVLTMVLSILGMAVLNIAVADNKFAVKQENKMQAYYIARSGAQAIAEYMMKDTNNNANDLIRTDNKFSDWNTQLNGGQFKILVTEDIPNNVVNIMSIGEYKGIQQQAKIRMTRSSDGVGGIFDYAIATQNGISVANSSGENILITGSVATKTGTIDLGTNGVVTGEKVNDPTLIFPAIVEPINQEPPIPYFYKYDVIDIDDGEKNKGTNLTLPSNNDLTYLYAEGIDLKNSKIIVTGSNIVHLYINGDIMLDTKSKFEVGNAAKLYIYVIGKRNVSLVGNGAQNNVFIYARDSQVTWNNAGSGDFFGSIIADTVILHNKTNIKYNPDMANEVDLDKTISGISFTGYTWVD